jgi:hypothetical protein
MAIYTDRIQLVFPINDPNKQRQAAASLQTLEITESGQEFEKLIPLDPSKVADYASQFNLPLLASIVELKTKHEEALTKLEQDHADALAEVQADLTTANATIATLQATIADLEATIVELTPPPKPESVTPAQIRLWLISNGISLDTVAQMIASIQDDTTRAAAQVRWEYGLVVLRDDPLVQQMGAALGFTTEQMDAAFLAASQIT